MPPANGGRGRSADPFGREVVRARHAIHCIMKMHISPTACDSSHRTLLPIKIEFALQFVFIVLGPLRERERAHNRWADGRTRIYRTYMYTVKMPEAACLPAIISARHFLCRRPHGILLSFRIHCRIRVCVCVRAYAETYLRPNKLLEIVHFLLSARARIDVIVMCALLCRSFA